MQPLVTIVTPSYNQGRFIRATIESVLSQDYPRLEYIVMDGGSTDTTAAVVREYSSKLRFVSERDRGQSHAINKGFRMAKGEILAWINSDDLLLPGAVSAAVRAFAENPAAGAVYGEGYLIDEGGSLTGRFPCTEPFNLWKLVHLSDYILQQSSYFRRAVLDDVGYIDEDLHYAMDWDIFIRIGKRYPLHYLREYMGCLREYNETKTSAGRTRRAHEITRVLRRHTGQWMPPGAIVYGLDTYRRVCCDWIGSHLGGIAPAPAKKLSSLVSFVTGCVVGRTITHAQGWYSDGWATRVVRCMVPSLAEGSLVIRGTMPDLSGILERQRLAVRSRGFDCHRQELPAGDFEIRIPIPESPARGAAEFTLEAERHFVPSRVNGGPDRRRLCYQLREIAVESAAGAKPAVPLPALTAF